jgi:hypothetical protein
VAFCVDVEIAGGPRYKDDLDTEEKKKRIKEKKLKEKGEGEALKHPDALVQQKEQQGAVAINDGQDKEEVGRDTSPNPEGTVIDDEKKEPSKKKEKKKRSEAERKERKEKKRRKAEENGSIPLELTLDDEDGSADGAPARNDTSTISRPQDRPTTDPLRIYRRCCQLRETPILKRISDQLQNPKTCSVVTPGVVTHLDLTGSRLQLADFVTLSDWLAIVPVKKLLLEDADLTDEKVRVVLAGLLAARIPGASRRRKSQESHAKNGTTNVEERSGVIVKLVLKNNPKIGAEGWRHISLFIYMCKSIQAIDCSMIPFPKARPPPPVHQTSASSQSSMTSQHPKPSKDTADILSKAISERLGGSRLEELALAECSLTAPTIRKVIDGVVISGVQRLSLAGNDIDDEGFSHVLHYIKSGVCQGLDLGGNDIRDRIQQLASCLSKTCPLWALSLADCDLTPESLKILFPALVSLPSFKFLDISHNQDLFAHQTSICLLRKYIPQLQDLKRIHLMDVSLSPEHAIGLAEVLPECAALAHVSILENPQITAVATATDEATQEEAAALYASLMVAAKLSHTIMCIDVDVPGQDSSEVVKALAKQVVAYCLRNMENYSDIPELRKPAQKDVEVPDVLMNLVEDVKGAESQTPAADSDYIVGGTGILKALNYCLLQKATDLRRTSVYASGTSTPRSRAEDSEESAKARKMSKDLLEGARNIRSRLQLALVREARAHNEMGYRKSFSFATFSHCTQSSQGIGRLLFLDQTLQGMIQRFEDEYPETRLPATDAASSHSSIPSTSPPASSVPTISTNNTDVFGSPESDEDEPKALRSRHNSDVSLASRALSLEEGRLHRLGHRVRTELINASRPSSSHSDQANVSGTMDEHDLPEHLVALREKFLNYSGEEIRQMTESVGWEKAFDHLVDNAEQLRQLREEDPEEFEKFRLTQIAALKNRNPGVHGPDEKKANGTLVDHKDECAVED